LSSFFSSTLGAQEAAPEVVELVVVVVDVHQEASKIQKRKLVCDKKENFDKGRQQQIICGRQLVAALLSVPGREEGIVLQKHQSNRCFRGSFVLILIASGHLQEMDRESLDLLSFPSPLSFFPPPLLGVLA
jgi:tRNA-binding EMAP/Myf-like protein